MTIRTKLIMLAAAAVAILGAVWAFNYRDALSKRLEEPVFLEHYIDLQDENYGYFHLYAIENVKDPVRPVRASFPEIPDVRITIGEPEPRERYYQIRKYTVNITEPSRRLADGQQRLDIRNMEVVYSNGEIGRPDIGRITLIPRTAGSAAEGGKPSLQFSSSGGIVIDGFSGGHDTKQAAEPLALIGWLLPEAPHLESNLELYFFKGERNQPRKDPLPLVKLPYTLEAGEFFTTAYTFKFPDSSASPGAMSVYQLNGELRFMRGDNSVFASKYIVQYTPTLDREMILEWVRPSLHKKSQETPGNS
ncbi:hypothetical protein [Paenibacillus sp. GCM10012303]|uniref:hypothetical protein n=1 Tax=Paenibacillus sp. GCM10012303 TaxID=3317340 RepID=UPI0036124AE7